MSDYGEGTIDQLPSGRYRVRVPDGTGKRLTVGVYDTWDEAEHARKVALQARHQLPAALSLGAYGERWLTRTATLRRNHRTDHSRWRQHVLGTPLGDAPLETVTRADVRDWMRAAIGREGVQGDGRKGGQRSTGRTVSRQTVVHALGLVRRALQEAVEDGHLEANPATGLKVPTAAEPGRDWTFLSAAEVRSVLELELGAEQRAVLTVAIHTGLRLGELAGLRWADLEGLGGGVESVVRMQVRQGWGGPLKTASSRRSLYLLPAAADALRGWRQHWERYPARRRAQGLVWPADGGACYARGYDWGWVGRLAPGGRVYWLGVRERAGVSRARFHDLRHTAASHLVMGSWTPAPWSLQAVRDYLGHTSVAVTERYAHLSPELQREAVARTGHGLVTPTPFVEAPEPAQVPEITAGRRYRNRTCGLRLRSTTRPAEDSDTCEARDQSVTSLAARVLNCAHEHGQIEDVDVVALAQAVLDVEPVRLALEIAALEPGDPQRGVLGLRLAALVATDDQRATDGRPAGDREGVGRG